MGDKVDFEKERAKKEEKESEGKKESYAVKYSRLSVILNKGGLGDRFYVVEPEKGVRRVLWDSGDGVVVYCNEAAVTSALTRYTRGKAGYCFDVRRAQDCMKYWLHTTDPIKEPPIVRMKSDDGLCFHRLPFDPVPYAFGKHPRFDEFLSRVSNKDALIDWIGSLFQLKSDRQQYVWLYGEGNNGKGAFIRFLEKCFGPSYAATETPTKGDKFWNYHLLGKRLIGFPDCGDSNFPTSQKFKMLSGDDQVPMEAKGKQVFSAHINCKFIFASNDKPSVTSQVADRRRAIFCEVGPIPGAVYSKYENELWKEARFVIGTCVEEYKRKYPENGPIEVDKEQIENVIEETEMDMERFFFLNFIRDERECDAERDRAWFGGHDLSDLMETTSISKKQFIKFLRSRFGIQYKTVRLGNDEKDVTKRYVGAMTVAAYAEATKEIKQELKKEGNHGVTIDIKMILNKINGVPL